MTHGERYHHFKDVVSRNRHGLLGGLRNTELARKLPVLLGIYRLQCGRGKQLDTTSLLMGLLKASHGESE